MDLEKNYARGDRTVILPVLYGCETWSLILTEVHRMRLFENREGRCLGLRGSR